MLQLKWGPNTIDGILSVIPEGGGVTSLIIILMERGFAHETVET